MNKFIKGLFASAVLPPLMLLTGCNSEEAFSAKFGSTQSTIPLEATLIEIAVTPSSTSLIISDTQQLVAMAKYDDGSEEDVTSSTTWEIVGDPTITHLTASGLVTGVAVGETEIVAKKYGILSNTVDADVCITRADACIDTFEVGSGKLFTNSPSKPYFDNTLGLSTSLVVNTETGTTGTSGVYYLFNYADANALCTAYNGMTLGGRTNWRLPDKEELEVELYGDLGNMFAARDWPTGSSYWSRTPDGSGYYHVNLFNGTSGSVTPAWVLYTSCVSES